LCNFESTGNNMEEKELIPTKELIDLNLEIDF